MQDRNDPYPIRAGVRRAALDNIHACLACAGYFFIRIQRLISLPEIHFKNKGTNPAGLLLHTSPRR